MKLVNFQYEGKRELGFYFNDVVIPFSRLAKDLPDNLLELLCAGDDVIAEAEGLYDQFSEDRSKVSGIEADKIEALAPITNPVSCRDAYAFRQHVATSRANRGLEMIPEFDQFPVFYFTNHLAIIGPGDVKCMPRHFEKLDFELEIAIVIGKKGRNIPAEAADEYIAGFMIMNDLSARGLQMREMKLNLGPAKGKDFATAIGPLFVTPKELEKFKVPCSPGHKGCAYELSMKAFLNGVQVSEGNFKDMDWTFAEIIERCSYGVTLYPGEIIGSGTVGTGCFLELNGTGRKAHKDYKDKWLNTGDEIVLEIDELGRLENHITEEV